VTLTNAGRDLDKPPFVPELVHPPAELPLGESDIDTREHAFLSLADVTERLFASYESRFDLSAIIGVVRRCRRELDSLPGPATLDRIAELAEVRLTDMLTALTALTAQGSA
jgi:hypothetical protein